MRYSLIALPLALALAACSQPADDAAPAPEPASAPEPETPAATAQVALAPTEGNETAGSLTFSIVDGVVHAVGEVTGLTPDAEHGFHLHEVGDCSAPDGTSAGGHFNPEHTDHGRAGRGVHHAGDSDNLEANAEGVASVDARFHGVSIGDSSGTDIIGRAVIVHADPDDYISQPTGNAGARLACGVIAAGM